jgi:hypothetical protein
MAGGIVHGKKIPQKSLTQEQPVCKSWVVRMLKPIKIDKVYKNWWYIDKLRLPTMEKQCQISDISLHTIRPSPQPNFVGRITKEQSQRIHLFKFNKNLLICDAQPSSTFWEPGCIIASGAPGLYVLGFFSLMTGGMAGNKLTGLTGIYISQTGTKDCEFPNKFTQNKQNWELQYYYHKEKLGICALAKKKQQPVRIFIQNSTITNENGEYIFSDKDQYSKAVLYFADAVVTKINTNNNSITLQDYYFKTKVCFSREYHNN